ncbi:M20/M25/M40 family metallo-hydrolase [Coxiella endosymbiont of Amblyomma nuttalli]|uniref:M20/M25/M40 family metallo-hydrolase n=1 Tax=Coxiella endosymbiont of Amblyomma nuttalli TaxID=2749996 RepID=UPI001BAC024A|nr:M20/M25/M40 family metallo-hydrolase [Coxiella endosymbiont of Amblyomma nuttalli]QTS83744.1 Succinyl-diaminopimelate desuccinylase [Coxiella endosymbiont of Amblyomma nuttalli]
MNNQIFEKNIEKIHQDISITWDKSIIPALINYIKIPNKSIFYDLNWKAHGYMDEAMQLIVAWCQKQPIRDLQLEVIQLSERTPLLFIEMPGQINETVLLYGHIDKQPEMKGWEKDLGPWKPVLREGKLYGRGAADDGYAVFAALTAIATLQRHQIPHARCIAIIEASEESGSIDLPPYLRYLKNRIGKPNLIICLDSGCGNYEQLWCTTSLRGNINGELKIEVLKNGIHSGLGSGIVPSPFLILRQLLDRIEDNHTGAITVDALKVAISEQNREQSKSIAEWMSQLISLHLPFLPNVKPVASDPLELLLNTFWRPQLSVTGLDGLPPVTNAGNVIIPSLSVVLSLRTPPVLDTEKAAQVLKSILEKEPPFNAKVSFHFESIAAGWIAPRLSTWLSRANAIASQQFFKKPVTYFGEGGTIPFMGMLGHMFPKAQFMITGVLGPLSNAHGPNEFLHIPMGKKITGCVASVVAAHYTHHGSKHR